MKTNYLLSVAIAFASLGMTNCSQSEDVAEDATGKQTISFVGGEETNNQAKTRTSMDGAYTDSSFPFYWEAGDQIYVATGTTTTATVNGPFIGNNTTTSSKAVFTGTVPSATNYYVRYTGSKDAATYSTTNTASTIITTACDGTHVIIPCVQTITESELGSTARLGLYGDCGTAKATKNSDGTYSFKLDHKAAYLIIMPRWPDNTNGNYKMKSVIISSQTVSGSLLAGRWNFSNSTNAFGSLVSGTKGSYAIKIITGDNSGVTLPVSTDQEKSLNIVIKPITTATPLHFIYEIYDTTSGDTYYIDKIISGKTFAGNTVTPITANIEQGYEDAKNGGYLDLITNNNIYYNYHTWDCPVEDELFFVSHEMGDHYNKATVNSSPTTDFTNVATAGCKNCPSYNELSWYLAGGVYVDKNKVWGPGTDQKGGVWFKKKQELFDEAVACNSNVTKSDYTVNTDDNFSSKYSGYNTATLLTTKPDTTKCFFLPFSGHMYTSPDYLYTVGTSGTYWTKSPLGTGIACEVSCSATTVTIAGDYDRASGGGLWTVK